MASKQGATKRPSGAQRRKAKAQALDSARVAWANTDTNSEPLQLPIYGIPPTTLVAAVQAALLQLEQGAFYAAAYLWDGMTRDDRLSATLDVRINGLVGSRLDVVAPDDTALAETVRDDTQKHISEIMPLHQVAALQRNGLGLSVGLAQRLTTRTIKSTMPTMFVWNNRNLRFDWTLRQFRLVTENKGEITVERGDPEWIIYEPFGPWGWINGAKIRSLAQPWLIRYWVRTWWARYQEVHGMPIRLGIIPVEREPKDERLFLSQLANLAHEATIRLPQGQEGNRFDVRLLEAQSTNWQGFKELLQHCDDSIAISLLGQRQSTMGTGGLGSQENAGESVRVDIKRGDALIGDVIRDQHLKPWTENEFGDAEAASKLKWQVEQSEDLAKKALQLSTLADAVLKFKSAEAPVDVRAMLHDCNVPLLAEGEPVPTAPGVETSDSTMSTNGQPAGEKVATPDAPQEDPMAQETAAAAATLAITATDLASIVKVDEGRKSVGLPPVSGDIGGKWIREHAAHLAHELPSEEVTAPAVQDEDPDTE